VSELFEEFQRLLGSSPSGQRVSGIQALLQVMEPESAEQLRLCAIPHEFSPPVLQALVPGMEGKQAEARCLEFAEFSIVSCAGGELSLHGAARSELFGEWLQPEHRRDFAAASERLVRYCETASGAADIARRETLAYQRMFHLVGADPPRGLAEFERLCRAARRESRWSGCTNLIGLLHEYDAVLTPQMAATITYHEGKLASDLRNFELADRLFMRLLEDSAGDSELRAKVLLRRGFVFCARRDFSQAIESYQRALAIAGSLSGSSIKVHHILSSLGEAYRDSGDLRKGEELLLRSLAGAERVGDFAGMASVHNDLGSISFRRRESRDAVAHYEQSLACLERAGDRFGAAQIYNNLGMVYTELRELATADSFFQRSLALKREAGDTLGQATSLLNRVRILRLQHDLPQAQEACRQAIELFGVIREVYGQAQAQRSLGRLLVASEDTEGARQALTAAAELFERGNTPQEAQQIRLELDQLGRKAGIPWWVSLTVLLGLLLIAAFIAFAIGNTS